MATDQKSTRDMSYSIFMAIFAVAMLYWAVAYGYANYEADRCMQRVESRIEGVKARIDAAKSMIDQRK